MRRFLIVLFVFTTQLAVCQGKKDVLYLNQNNQQITRRQFKSFEEDKHYIKIFEKDTVTIKKILSHKNIAKLDSLQTKQFKTFLAKIIGKDYNDNKKTMIHLYSENGKKIKKDSEYNRYWSWVEENSDEYQAYLIGTKDSKINPDKKNHIYVDSYDLIKNLFFRGSNFKINHLLLKPNGTVYVYYGLNDILNVLDWSVD